MKKTLFLILAALTLFTFKGFAEEDSLLTDNRTYYYILEKCEYSTRMIDKKYVKGNILEDILNNLFATDISFGFEPYDDISGEELLDVLENDLKLPVDFIENKPSLKKRILTYPVLFETLDYYFDEIIKIQGLKREYGVFSKNKDGWLLTMDGGDICEYNEPPHFIMENDMVNVEIIKDGEKIIEIISTQVTAGIKELYNKCEISGKLFILYDNCIVVNTNGELRKFAITDSFMLLKRTNQMETDMEVVLLTGTYKKNSNVTAVAIERMN